MFKRGVDKCGYYNNRLSYTNDSFHTALNYVLGKQLCFVISIQETPLDCDCSNCHTNIKTLKTKVLFETELLDKECYDIYEDQRVKVFVLKDLKIIGDMNVYLKSKMPFLGPKFGIKGITA